MNNNRKTEGEDAHEDIPAWMREFLTQYVLSNQHMNESMFIQTIVLFRTCRRTLPAVGQILLLNVLSMNNMLTLNRYQMGKWKSDDGWTHSLQVSYM